jgi:solute carrier family 44 (choline transporter-like protein), member 2/4/5
LSGSDKSYLNEIKFDKDIAKSPVDKPRNCTDMLCCIVFTVTLVSMFFCSILGYVTGAPWKLVAPIDGDNRICGYTPGTEGYTHLYIANIDDAATPSNVHNVFEYGVCVKECPTEKGQAIECVPTTEIKSCTIPADEQYTTYEVFSYCIPNYDSLPEDTKKNWDTLQTAVAGSSFGDFFADIMTSKWVICISVLICVLITFIYIVLMHYCAFWLSWISVGLIQIALVAIGYFAFDYRRDQISENAAYEEESMATYLQIITWLSWIMAAIYYIVIICSFQSLRVAVAVIQTASSFVADSKRLIFVPVLYFGVAVICSGMFVAGAVCVASIGDIKVDNAAYQSKSIEWSSQTEYMFYFMVFGFFWVLAFIMAVNEFVIIVAGITWYYSDKEIPDDDGIPGDSDVTTGMYWSVRYHAGTLAAGSLIVAIVWVIRVVFEYVAKKMEGASGENGCTKCLVGCIRCCLSCFDRFIRYINRNAYIYCALTGESFCSSALNSFILILKNSAKFGFVEGIAGCFMFIAKFFISIMTTLVSFFVLQGMVEVSSPYAPLLVIFLFSWAIATIFIEIFDTGANTILQCYLLDREVGLCDDEHIPKSLKKFFSDDEIRIAMEKGKVEENNEPMMDGANRMD